MLNFPKCEFNYWIKWVYLLIHFYKDMISSKIEFPTLLDSSYWTTYFPYWDVRLTFLYYIPLSSNKWYWWEGIMIGRVLLFKTKKQKISNWLFKIDDYRLILIMISRSFYLSVLDTLISFGLEIYSFWIMLWLLFWIDLS